MEKRYMLELTQAEREICWHMGLAMQNHIKRDAKYKWIDDAMNLAFDLHRRAKLVLPAVPDGGC